MPEGKFRWHNNSHLHSHCNKIKSQSQQSNDFQNKSAVIHPIKLWLCLCSYFIFRPLLTKRNQLTYITQFFYFNYIFVIIFITHFYNVLVIVQRCIQNVYDDNMVEYEKKKKTEIIAVWFHANNNIVIVKRYFYITRKLGIAFPFFSCIHIFVVYFNRTA